MLIHGNLKVKDFKKSFFEEFGLSVRVYDGRSFADEDKTLASLGKGEISEVEFTSQKNMKIGNLESKILKNFGLKTQVTGSDDSYLCKDNLTLAEAKKKDTKRLEKRESTNEDLKNSKKFIVEVYGVGGEVCIGEIDDIIFESIMDEGIGKTEFESGDDFVQYFEIDDILHEFSVDVQELELIVKDDDGNELAKYTSSDGINFQTFTEPSFVDDKIILASYSCEKGHFFNLEIYDQKFDINKLFFGTILTEEYGFDLEMIDRAFYGNVKSSNFEEFIDNILFEEEAELPKDVVEIDIEKDQAGDTRGVSFNQNLWEEGELTMSE